MLSRSHILIEKELLSVKKERPTGISVALINENIYEWSARIAGPSDSPWEGGIFRVYIKFDENYNVCPPKVCFHTIPYHPNIDMITGRPCIDYLNDAQRWNPAIRIGELLVQIQDMLKNPVLDDAVNPEAASMFRNSYQAYTKVARECVEYSQLLDRGKVDASKDGRQYNLQEAQQTQNQPAGVELGNEPRKEKKTTKLSFEDYYSQWSGMATTKPTQGSINPYTDTIKDNSHLMMVHFGLSEEEREEERYNKQIDYDAVYYGTLDRQEKNKAAIDANSKLARISQMRRIYLPKKPLPTPRSPNRHSDSEGEVENLVAWTQNLNTDDLDMM